MNDHDPLPAYHAAVRDLVAAALALEVAWAPIRDAALASPPSPGTRAMLDQLAPALAEQIEREFEDPYEIGETLHDAAGELEAIADRLQS